MLKRQLVAHLRHSSTLLRHLHQRRLAALQVQGTTSLPFLRTIGMIASPPRISASRSWNRDLDFLAATEELSVGPIIDRPELAEEGPDELPPPLQRELQSETLLQRTSEPSASTNEEQGQEPGAALPNVASQRIEDSNLLSAVQQPPQRGTDFPNAKLSRTVGSPAFIPEGSAVQLHSKPDHGQIPVTAQEAGSSVPIPTETYAEPTNQDTPAATTGVESASVLSNIPVPANASQTAPKVPPKRTLLERVAEIISGAKKVSTEPRIPGALNGEPAEFEPASQAVANMPILPAEDAGVQATGTSEVQAKVQIPNATTVTPAVPSYPRRAQIEEAPQSKTAQEKVKEVAKPRARTTRPSGPPWSRTNQPEAAADSNEAADLFEPRADTDRSPTSWRERLAEAIRVETDLQSSTRTTDKRATDPRPRETAAAFRPFPKMARRAVRGKQTAARLLLSKPAPMSESARRFLTPLVGFDPRDVSLEQGPAVSRVLAAANADAIAEGDSILLGPGQNESSPQTLGLLAHELTHVARGREPSFVPSIVRPVPAVRAEESPSSRIASATTLRNPLPETTDEETLARRVEGAVQAAAQGIGIENDNAGNNSRESRAQTSLLTSSARHGSNIEASNENSHDPWGGLPAPWEPMPEWVHASEIPDEASRADVDTTVSTSNSAVSSSSPSISATGPARADVERSLSEEAPADAHEESEHKDKKVTPDLDALAKQVYAIMRQRLAADRRREFMY